jgi:nodulation protein E
VRGFDASAHFDEKTLGGLDRFSQFAAVAARQAWTESGLDRDPPPSERIGVIIGTANGGVDVLEQGWRRLLVEGRKPFPLTIPMTMASAPASRIAREIGARGPVFAVSSACASSAHAIFTGLTLLRAGMADVMVVGGTDSCFNFGYLRVWDALRVVSPEVCRPFSKGRLGLTIGEGAGVVILEAPGRAKARGARVLSRLVGAGMSSDAGDLTSPDKAGMIRAMENAIANCGIARQQVGYINAHGTGTLINDRVEAQAIRDVFGARTDRLPVSSVKSSIGHAMGASGALEILTTIATLEKQVAPPTLNFVTPDPDCPIDCVPEGPRKIEVEVALSNSFAFGGLNVTLALARP